MIFNLISYLKQSVWFHFLSVFKVSGFKKGHFIQNRFPLWMWFPRRSGIAPWAFRILQSLWLLSVRDALQLRLTRRRFLYSGCIGLYHRAPPVPTVKKHQSKTRLQPPPQQLHISASIFLCCCSRCAAAQARRARLAWLLLFLWPLRKEAHAFLYTVAERWRLPWSHLPSPAQLVLYDAAAASGEQKCDFQAQVKHLEV